MKSDFKEAMDRVKALRVKAMKNMVKQKKTPKEIANFIGVSRQRVHQIAAEAGITLYYGDNK